MDEVFEFLLVFLSQFAGGPGPAENNLTRFGLPSLLWAALLYITWSRQRFQKLPRERLLVWGFGLGLARELYMFAETSAKVMGWVGTKNTPPIHQPVEHALSMAAIVVIAAAFLRYILDDRHISRRYLIAGLGFTAISFLVTAWAWPRQLATKPQLLFHQTWEAWLFHVSSSFLIVAAMLAMSRQRGWLRNVVTVALAFFLLSEILILINYATDRVYSQIFCPIGNSFHILAIPLLAYVYLQEQSIEKKKAEQALSAYRNQLEALVEERTAELQAANNLLNQEILERKRVQAELAQRNTRLAAQNAVAATLSQSLEPETILNSALDTVLSVLEIEAGFICLLDTDKGTLEPQIYGGDVSLEVLQDSLLQQCPYWEISKEALEKRQPVVRKCIVSMVVDRTNDITEGKLCTLVSTPLVSREKPMGVLLLGTRQEDAFQQPDVALLTGIGQQIGMALMNANLHQQLEWSAALEERQRIAANMHDGLAQTLSLLGLEVDQTDELLEIGTVQQAATALGHIRDTIGQASAEVRHSIATLQDTPQPRRTLQDLLGDLANQLSQEDHFIIDLIVRTPDPLFLSPAHQEQVLPVVQEALHNARRHAQVEKVQIELELLDKMVCLSVKDEGLGFNPQALPTNGEDHFGLSIMRARAARIGGQLHVDSAAGAGTRVSLTWPTDNDRDQLIHDTIEVGAVPLEAMSLRIN